MGRIKPHVRRWRGGEIFSYHNFSHTPENLEEILQEMQKTPATYYKIATMAHSTLDSLRMLALMKAHPNLIGVCMGKKGEITRILGPVFGCPIIYASLNADWQSAPGQLTARELCDTYRFRTLNPSTALYGLIGDPVDLHQPPVPQCAFGQTRAQRRLREDGDQNRGAIRIF